MARKWIVLLLISLVATLAACSGESTAEKIHTHLEETVVQEEGYKNQQSEITALEKKEQEIYGQIIELDMEEFDQIKSLADEALVVIDEREEKVNLEKESITNASEEFHSVEALLADLEDEAVNAKGQEMYDTMLERYATYDELYTAYMESLELERELYEMLQLEELDQEALNEHIGKINASYETIFNVNDKFNELTVSYNQLKQEFYEAAEMNVSYSENEEAEK